MTGADIITDQDTEVLNPELHIATLDKNANLNMEIYVDIGRGYVSADKNKSKDQPLDSFLSTPSILRSRASSLVSPILVSATSPTMTA